MDIFYLAGVALLFVLVTGLAVGCGRLGSAK